MLLILVPIQAFYSRIFKPGLLKALVTIIGRVVPTPVDFFYVCPSRSV